MRNNYDRYWDYVNTQKNKVPVGYLDPSSDLQTDYYTGHATADQLAAIDAYGAFKTADKKGQYYQPQGVIINGKDYGRLGDSGYNVSDYNKDYTNSSGVNVAGQSVWVTPDGQKWIWNGSKMTYEPFNNALNSQTSVPNNTGSGGGGGGYNVSTAPSTAVKHDWLNESPERIAELMGIEHNTYEEILGLYNEASNAKFDELDTQAKRNQAENLRTLEGQYNTYLDSIRQDRANAVSSGMMKGQAAANMLATNFANAGVISEGQQVFEDLQYDLGLQRATALDEDKVAAQQEMSNLGQYIGTLKGQYENVAVAELAARLADETALKTAQIQANATENAAAYSSPYNTYQFILDQYVQQTGSASAGWQEFVKNHVPDLSQIQSY